MQHININIEQPNLSAIIFNAQTSLPYNVCVLKIVLDQNVNIDKAIIYVTNNFKNIIKQYEEKINHSTVKNMHIYGIELYHNGTLRLSLGYDKFITDHLLPKVYKGQELTNEQNLFKDELNKYHASNENKCSLMNVIVEHWNFTKSSSSTDEPEEIKLLKEKKKQLATQLHETLKKIYYDNLCTFLNGLLENGYLIPKKIESSLNNSDNEQIEQLLEKNNTLSASRIEEKDPQDYFIEILEKLDNIIWDDLFKIKSTQLNTQLMKYKQNKDLLNSITNAISTMNNNIQILENQLNEKNSNREHLQEGIGKRKNVIAKLENLKKLYSTFCQNIKNGLQNAEEIIDRIQKNIKDIETDIIKTTQDNAQRQKSERTEKLNNLLLKRNNLTFPTEKTWEERLQKIIAEQQLAEHQRQLAAEAEAKRKKMQKIGIGVSCAAAALAAYWFVPGFSDYVNQLANNIKLSHVWNYMATKAHSMTSYFMPTTPINTQK